MELTSLTIGKLSPLLRRKEVSPREVVEAFLERVHRLNGSLGAYITVMEESALRQAREEERCIMEGDYHGPLHGIPLALKDLIDTKGVKTTSGSKILAGHVPEEDATVVERLRAAGAIILGKANLHEFAFGATNENPHYGPARNPWDKERIPGGSSGGSAVAVAAGLAAGALGSDTGGSVRIPASLCGIVGLKPTYGRVSRHGVFPLSWSMDHLGPMTKSVEDAAFLLSAMAGYDPRDASSSPAPVPRYARTLRRGVKGLKVGCPRAYFFEGMAG
ncbi:MAG: amidase, partial [Chloroflexota bacterium]|nr:amidase [Chloroflexota bacterium]